MASASMLDPALETFTLVDGIVITIEPSGRGFTQVNPSGVVIREFGNGASKQINPDGIVIEISADKTLTTQVNPDGTRFEATNKGEITTYFVDGTVMLDYGNGNKRQTNPDGYMITTYADGRKVQVDAAAQTELTVYPDGSIDQWNKRTGVKLHSTPDGKVTQIN